MRAADVQLLVVSTVIGALVAGLTTRRSKSVGAGVLVAALTPAIVVDRLRLEALPGDPWPGLRAAGLAALASVVVARGASRLPTAPVARVPVVLPLVLAALAGVWAGVPETSPALVGAGVLLGLAAVATLHGVGLTRPAAALAAVFPMAAAAVGAGDRRQALAGGLLAGAALAWFAVVRPPRRAALIGAVLATALALTAALLSARQVAIRTTWDGVLPWVGAVLVISATAAVALRAQHALRR